MGEVPAIFGVRLKGFIWDYKGMCRAQSQCRGGGVVQVEGLRGMGFRRVVWGYLGIQRVPIM